jgi:O-6-methylguanine DNA methyltransferase
MTEPSRRDVFATRLGTMKATWVGDELAHLSFLGENEDLKPDRKTSQLGRDVQAHFHGQSRDFSSLAIHHADLSAFAQTVYRAARDIPSGKVQTYGEIAKRIGKPGASRAVGTALGNNPILLVIPCHRVLASSGGLGGFSAPGGLLTKELMLAAEGYGVESLWENDELAKAHDRLLGCPRLGPVVKRVGPCELSPLYPDTPFGALARAVLYQQLATSAARAIEKRVKGLGSAPFPTASELNSMEFETLRKAGVSGPKIATLKRLAEATLDGTLQPELLHRLPNQHVESQISAIKGLGNWSARMFLLFHLGRRDIWPVKDLGIRKGFQKLFVTKGLPQPDIMERKSRPWKPYRSLASWYLWRSLELD